MNKNEIEIGKVYGFKENAYSISQYLLVEVIEKGEGGIRVIAVDTNRTAYSYARKEPGEVFYTTGRSIETTQETVEHSRRKMNEEESRKTQEKIRINTRNLNALYALARVGVLAPFDFRYGLIEGVFAFSGQGHGVDVGTSPAAAAVVDAIGRLAEYESGGSYDQRQIIKDRLSEGAAIYETAPKNEDGSLRYNAAREASISSFYDPEKSIDDNWRSLGFQIANASAEQERMAKADADFTLKAAVAIRTAKEQMPTTSANASRDVPGGWLGKQVLSLLRKGATAKADGHGGVRVDLDGQAMTVGATLASALVQSGHLNANLTLRNGGAE